MTETRENAGLNSMMLPFFSSKTEIPKVSPDFLITFDWFTIDCALDGLKFVSNSTPHQNIDLLNISCWMPNRRSCHNDQM